MLTAAGKIGDGLAKNSMKLDDEKIRFQIESKTRQHLDWIRVNGILSRRVFGCSCLRSRASSQNHGTEILARLHLGF